ncbi:uncharacterized protein HMPREF1541_08715 [Cyphellophora europaea CBS 101466]|uniref:Cytochrome P450 n=1 Tax=Cyphellophora europaea (strain CBS 101466) TaxID=1220924 RepID=W2RIX9_CYPE1|nr:uncharacterized protein HMPREF1541_08715 [Cyphellophora europaea CBS 101466]ETN36437.1 hypothetical protein HMPREF1541_08715 [Cyphellophora europaea CBS 101466]
MHSILLILLTIPIAFILHQLFRLHRNLSQLAALPYPVPAVIVPASPISILYQTFGDPLAHLLSLLPLALQPACTVHIPRDSRFYDKSQTAQRLGPIWALVSPGSVHFQIYDPGAGLEVLERRDVGKGNGGFERPSDNYELLNVFGPNLSTSDNANWPRHRKVLAAPFSEAVMDDVWRETLQHANALVKSWEGRAVTTVSKDLRTLSLNVLATAGFKKEVEFRSAMDEDETENQEGPMSYRDALQMVLDNIILILVMGTDSLNRAFWSQRWQKVGAAAEAFKKHMSRMLDEEEAALAKGEKGGGGILTAFVRALTTNIKSNASDVDRKVPRGLSRAEVFGNIFVINFAGHDTTANTLAFAALLLTAYPEVQDWLAEEVQYYTRNSAWQYAELFPRLKRCRAVLRETLRLYTPVPGIPKRTTSQAQTVTLTTPGYEGRKVVLLPNSICNVGVLAVHTHPKIWGEDALVWRPGRWIPDGGSGVSDLDREVLLEPKKGTYAPWSDGPQNCPGLKFSEVEFVAVMTAIFGGGRRLEAVVMPGEDQEDTRRRVLSVVNDVDMQMLLRMRHGDAVKVKLQSI